MKFFFFKTTKPKAFEYKPLYYDPEKEKRELRKKELGLADSADHKSFFRGELKSKWKRSGPDDKKSSKRRTIIYLVLLLITIYYVFFTDFIQKLIGII